MSKYSLQKYKHDILRRRTCSPQITEYIDNCLTSEDEAARHSFHKIMIPNWNDTIEEACDVLSQHFGTAFVPVCKTDNIDTVSFYTSSLNLIQKIIKFDFVFPFKRATFVMAVIFNDKSSFEIFKCDETIDEIVSRVVSNRFTSKFELDLSDFCNDIKFKQKNIHFYKLSLLAQFKILMLRMGRDTKLLNLSSNNLRCPPQDILNFFIKGDLVAINLSYNNIPKMSELLRVSSKIERLWLEGNPLCEDLCISEYIKNTLSKFPRLTELDGINIKDNGIMFPFQRNFLQTPDNRTRIIVDKFLTSYFTHYDATCGGRKRVMSFYDVKATLTFNTTVTGPPIKALPHISQHVRNIILSPDKFFRHVYIHRTAICQALNQFPNTIHDPTTFTVDVLMHDNKCLILVVEGIYKETVHPDKLFHFRRTFVFTIKSEITNSLYHITNEIYSISFATDEQAHNCFKHPIANLNSLSVINPDEEELEVIANLFSQITNLKTSESLLRLKMQNWNIREALCRFMKDVRANRMSIDKLKNNEDEFSDGSSMMDDID